MTVGYDYLLPSTISRWLFQCERDRSRNSRLGRRRRRKWRRRRRKRYHACAAMFAAMACHCFMESCRAVMPFLQRTFTAHFNCVPVLRHIPAAPQLCIALCRSASGTEFAACSSLARLLRADVGVRWSAGLCRPGRRTSKRGRRRSTPLRAGARPRLRARDSKSVTLPPASMIQLTPQASAFVLNAWTALAQIQKSKTRERSPSKKSYYKRPPSSNLGRADVLFSLNLGCAGNSRWTRSRASAAAGDAASLRHRPSSPGAQHSTAQHTAKQSRAHSEAQCPSFVAHYPLLIAHRRAHSIWQSKAQHSTQHYAHRTATVWWNARLRVRPCDRASTG